MKVMATKLGFDGIQRRKAGDVFTIKDQQAFSDNWMKKLDSGELEDATKAQAIQKKQAVETFNAAPRPAKSSPSPFYGEGALAKNAGKKASAKASSSEGEEGLLAKAGHAVKSATAAAKKAVSSSEKKEEA